MLAHPSQMLIGELIGRTCSDDSLSSFTMLKIFSSKTAWLIKSKFYVDHTWEGGTNVYENDPRHMTKMGAEAVNSKNL